MTVALPGNLRARWHDLQPRERRALLIMVAALAVALLGQLLWLAHTERQRLRTQLPRLAVQLEALKAGAEEWRQMATLPERQMPPPGSELRKNIGADAAALGLAASWRDAGSLQLKGQAGFDAWVRWLGQVQQDHGLRIVAAKIRVSAPGQVAVEAELAFPPGKDGR